MPAIQADLTGVAAAPSIGLSADTAIFDSRLSTAQAAQRLTEDGPNALPGRQ